MEIPKKTLRKYRRVMLASPVLAPAARASLRAVLGHAAAWSPDPARREAAAGALAQLGRGGWDDEAVWLALGVPGAQACWAVSPGRCAGPFWSWCPVSGKRAAMLAAAMAEEGYARLEALGVARCCLPPYPEMVGLMWPTAVGVLAMRRRAKRAGRKKKTARQLEVRLVRQALAGGG